MADLCDSNVWLALTLSEHVHQAPARAWLETAVEPRSVLFCRATQQSLLRLLTTAAVLAPYGNPPLTNRQAWAVYQAFAADERVALIEDEPVGFQAGWVRFAAADQASPKLWMDAYLAAFAQCSGLRMVTTDSAFATFGDLDVLVVSSAA